MTRLSLLGTIFLTCALLTGGCALDSSQKAQFETQVAATVYAEQTRLTSPTPTALPTAKSTPTPKPTPTPPLTPTPAPDAVVLGRHLGVYDGPGDDFKLICVVFEGEQLAVQGAYGGYQYCQWLNVIATDGSQGWIENDPENLQVNIGCYGLPIPSFRPLTGMSVIKDSYGVYTRNADVYPFEGSGWGYGNLSTFAVENKSTLDAVVLLIDEDDHRTSFYIRAGESYRLEGFPEGKYEVFITTGLDWDYGQSAFLTRPTYERFINPIEFKSSWEPGAKATEWTLTLGTAQASSMQTEQISPQEFPSLELGI
jgi:hypothetical protein